LTLISVKTPTLIVILASIDGTLLLYPLSMRSTFLIIFSLTIYATYHAQKVDSIYFNLYTDSLKKGFYNYINIDGKLSDGTWMPLDSTQVRLESNIGFFKGNDLFIDSSYKAETVTIKAILRHDPKVCRQTTIYIRKRGFNEPLKSKDEILEEMQQKRKGK
jgi:hypothetical protein